MLRILLGISIAALSCSASFAETADRSHAYDDFIALQAQKHGVPESLVHRILRRESRYDPKVFHNHCYGLMQIKYGTARSMGFNGAPNNLFDPYVNMTYAIPYLANAYRIAEGDEDRAVALFAGGYYYQAKKKQMLSALRTAVSPPLAPEPPPPAPARPQNAMPNVFAFLQSPAQSPVQPAQVEVTQAAMQVAAQSAPQTASMAPPPVEPVAQTTSPAPTGQQQAADQAQPVPEATASIDAPKSHAADAKHHDKAGSHQAAKLAKTNITLAAKADAAPEGAITAQRQAAAEQMEPTQDATASIDAPKSHAADAKHHDKAGSHQAAKLAKTNITLAAKADAAPEGAITAQRQAAAEQNEPAQDATASIEAPKPHAADAKHHDKAGSHKAAKLTKSKTALAGKADAARDGAKSGQQQAAAGQMEPAQAATASIDAPKPNAVDAERHDKAGSLKADKPAKTKIALAGKADGAKAAAQAPHRTKEARAHAVSTAAAGQASDADAGPATGIENPIAERPSAATEPGGSF